MPGVRLLNALHLEKEAQVLGSALEAGFLAGLAGARPVEAMGA